LDCIKSEYSVPDNERTPAFRRLFNIDGVLPDSVLKQINDPRLTDEIVPGLPFKPAE
jgi:hypothetical protein